MKFTDINPLIDYLDFLPYLDFFDFFYLNLCQLPKCLPKGTGSLFAKLGHEGLNQQSFHFKSNDSTYPVTLLYLVNCIV